MMAWTVLDDLNPTAAAVSPIAGPRQHQLHHPPVSALTINQLHIVRFYGVPTRLRGYPNPHVVAVIQAVIKTPAAA
jgi:hypothetical protein